MAIAQQGHKMKQLSVVSRMNIELLYQYSLKDLHIHKIHTVFIRPEYTGIYVPGSGMYFTGGYPGTRITVSARIHLKFELSF